MELSCAADSPARSEQQQRHSCEPEEHLRRQLQRFVMWMAVALYSVMTESTQRSLSFGYSNPKCHGSYVFPKALNLASSSSIPFVRISFAPSLSPLL